MIVLRCDQHNPRMMRTIRYYVDLRARETPNATYLIAPETGTTLNYATLQQNAGVLARYLAGLGLAKGDKVALDRKSTRLNSSH